MKSLALYPLRILAVFLLLANLGIAILTPFPVSGIIGTAVMASVLLYDLGTALGQRRNFIADAEERGMTGYAEELRGRKW